MATTAPRSSFLFRSTTVVFIVAILLRLLVLARYTATPYFAQQMGDMKFYHDWALRIVAGQFTDGHAFYGLPGYAYLLALVYKVVGPNLTVNWFVIAAVQSVCEALTSVIIFIIATQVCEFSVRRSPAPGVDPRLPTLAGAVAALAYVLFVPAQTFSIILMPTAWLVCAYWWCVWQAMRPVGKRPTLVWLGMGLLIGVVAMMIATILFAIPMLLVAIALDGREGKNGNDGSLAAATPLLARLRHALFAVILLFAGVGLGTSPAWIHNYFVAHDPVLLSAHSGLNFYMGNNPVANGYPKIPDGLRPGQEGLLKDSILRAEEAAGHPLKRTEVSRYWSEKASAYIHENRGAWLMLMGTKVRNFWNGFQYDDISVITLLQERGVTLPGPRFGFVAALGLAGLLAGVWRNGPVRWVAAAVLLHMCALLSVFITERYRLAAVPGLIILSVYALWMLWRALAERKWPLAGGLALLIAGSALATSTPPRDPALWSLDPYNLGVKELEVAESLLAKRQGDDSATIAERHEQATHELESAQRHLEKAYSYLQGNAGIVFALGNLTLDRGDRERAREWYQRALVIDPHFSAASKNLGYLALEDQQWAEAARLLEAAAREEPDNASTWYLLAKAKIGLGDPATARTMLKEALRMKPNQKEFRELATQLGGVQ